MPVRLESPTEFVELDVKKKDLYRTSGALGDEGETRSWSFPSVGGAKDELARQVAKYTAAGFAEVTAPGAGPEEAAPFEGVPARTLKSLLGKLAKAEDTDAVVEALTGAVGGDRQSALGWHCLPAVPFPGAHALIAHLVTQREAVDASRAARVASLLRQSPTPLRDRWTEWFSGWSCNLDRLVFGAMAAAPEAFAAQEASYPPVSAAGLAFVRRRRGLPIGDAARLDVLRRVAEEQASRYGVSPGELPCLDGAGREAEIAVPDGDADAIALRLGTRDEWAGALAAAAKRNRWHSIVCVGAGVVHMPLSDLVAMFCAHRSDPFGQRATAPAETMDLLARRDDTPAALLEVAAALPAVASVHENQIREVFAVTAARKLLAEGREVPVSFDEHVRDFALLDTSAADVLLDVLRQLPRERVLSRVRGRTGVWGCSAIGVMGAHYDAEIFEGFLASKPYESSALLGMAGAAGLSALARSIPQTPEDVREDRREALFIAMGRALRGGAELGEEWDEALSRPLKASDDVRLSVVALLPAKRRDRIRAGTAARSG